jgi:hypothetical protein
MRFLLRGATTFALVLVAAGCGITGDELKDAASTTSTTAPSTESSTESSTTTEPDDTTTTAGEQDPELADLLMSGDDFGPDFTQDEDSSDNQIDAEYCDGHTFEVEWTRQAAAGFSSSDETTFAVETIVDFADESDARSFLTEFQEINEVCKDVGDGPTPCRSRSSRWRTSATKHCAPSPTRAPIPSR